MKTKNSFKTLMIQEDIKMEFSEMSFLRGGSGDGIPIGEDILIPDEEEPED
jgi:hypothetical protein